MKSNEFETQINRFIDGELNDTESFDFLQVVGSSDDYARKFAESSIQHQHLSELVAEDGISLSGSAGRSRRPLLFAMAALISSILISGFWFAGKNDIIPSAVISHAVGAHWDDAGTHVPVGQGIEEGSYRLTSGLVRIDFHHGATMTVQGPASFEVINDMHVAFSSGIATFQVPEPAIGFKVDTATANIVDLGTAFGIDCSASGTHVSVFEGEVAVSQSGETETLVKEGESIQAGEEIVPVTYNTTTFEKAWPLNLGVLQTTGKMKFVSPGPDFTPGAFEDSEHITVFPERQNAKVPKGLVVDVVDPGEYLKIRKTGGSTVSRSKRLRSYLLQLDPVGIAAKRDPDKFRVQGQITFDSPIAGIIASHDKLRKTDVAFGHPEGIYHDGPRGVEPPRPARLDQAGRDIVILTADYRTLIVDFSAASAVDQIRVLVENKNSKAP